MKRLPIAAIAAGFACPVWAQTFPSPVVPLVGCSSMGNCSGPVSSTNPMPVSGGFQPAAVGTPIAVTTSGVTGTLPSGTVVVASNVGSNTAYCALGASSSTAQQPIPAGGWFAFTVGSATQLTCLTSTGTTTVNTVGGSGLPMGSGGGSGSGGSVPTGSAGSPNDSIVTVQGISGGTGVPVTGNFWQTTQPVSVASLPALAAGSATIGSVDVLGHAGGALDTAAGTTASALLSVQGSPSGVAIPVSGTFWQSTQPVSAASLPLPTGASTSANQINGTQETQIVGNSNIAYVDTSHGQLVDPGSATLWGLMSGTTPGTAPTYTGIVGGIYNSSTPSPSTGQTLPFQLDSSGNLNVNIKAGAGSGGTAAADNSSWTAGTTNQTPIGCEYTSGGAAALTTAHVGTVGCTSARSMFTDLSSEAGTAVTSTPTAYGTAPTGNVIGVNSYVTNSSLTTIATNTATIGATADTAYAGSGSASLDAILKGLYTAATASIPAGSATIGKLDLLGNAGGVLDTGAGTPASTLLGVQGGGPGAAPASVIPPTVTTGGLVSGATAPMTATTSTQVIAAVSSKRIYVTAIHCNNSSGTATLVSIQDGSGGTTLDTLGAGATYGGDNRSGTLPLFWTTAGNGLYAADVTTGASVICQASGYAL